MTRMFLIYADKLYKKKIKLFLHSNAVLDDNEVSKIVSQVFILYTLVTDIHLVDYFTWRERQVLKWNTLEICYVLSIFCSKYYIFTFLLKMFPVKTLSCDKFEHFFFLRHIASPSGISIFLFTGITEQLSQKIKILWHKMLKEMNLLNVSSTLKWSLL